MTVVYTWRRKRQEAVNVLCSSFHDSCDCDRHRPSYWWDRTKVPTRGSIDVIYIRRTAVGSRGPEQLYHAQSQHCLNASLSLHVYTDTLRPFYLPCKGEAFPPSLFLPFFLPSPPLEVGPLNPARWSGERCKLPQWGPGRSPGRKRIFWPFWAHKTLLMATKLFYFSSSVIRILGESFT